MHIVGMLIGLFGTVGYFLWRMHMAAQATRGLVDAADDLRLMLRKRKWTKKTKFNPLDDVSDARVAAAAMMVVLAQADGPMTCSEEDEIRSQIKMTFGTDARVAEDMLAYARWLVEDNREASNVYLKLKGLFHAQCGPEERQQLVAMLVGVVALSGRNDSPEVMLVNQIKHELEVRGNVGA